jgi:NAD-dependent deacetylase
MNHIPHVAEWLASSKLALAFTGAGISTESGIPDFRSPGGVWSRCRQVMFDEFLTDADARFEYWRQKSEAQQAFSDAVPNVGHRVLADWEATARLAAVITQNIDGLHQLAGSRRVLELHGTAREIACLSCHWRHPAEPLVTEFRQTMRIPACPNCGGFLKHATISFGQAMPENTLAEAFELARSADLVLSIGSSLVVEPAASVPRIAKQFGARLVIINRDETSLDEIADAVLRAPAGETLIALSAAVQVLAQPGTKADESVPAG